jgi:hypothetical protein
MWAKAIQSCASVTWEPVFGDVQLGFHECNCGSVCGRGS